MKIKGKAYTTSRLLVAYFIHKFGFGKSPRRNINNNNNKEVRIVHRGKIIIRVLIVHRVYSDVT